MAWAALFTLSILAGSPAQSAAPAQQAVATGPNWAEVVTAVATVAIGLGALFALLQLRESKRSRHTESAARMSSRWETEAFVEARVQIDSYKDNMALRDALVHSMDQRTAVRHPLLRELTFFEELGAMEKLGATSLRWIDETMRDLVLDRWRLWQPTVDELERRDGAAIYRNFRELVAKLQGRHLTRRQRLNRWLARRLAY